MRAGMTPVLDDALRAEFQAEGEWPILARHVVRWSEVDAYAHVNHTCYLEWYEDARIRLMEEAGLRLGPDRPGPVLARIEVAYRQPAHFRDEVLVGARVTSFRRTSLVMDYATWVAGRGLVNSATALCVMFVNTTGEKAAIPDSARQLWTARHNAKGE